MRDNVILTVSQLNEYLTNLTGSLEFMEHPGIIELQEAIQAYEALRQAHTREEYVAAERVRLAAHNAEILDLNLLGDIDLQVYNVQGEILTALGDTVLSDNIMTLPALDAALRAEIPQRLAPGGAGRNTLNTIRSLALQIEDTAAGDDRYMLLERLRRQLSRNSGLFSDDDDGVWERLLGESDSRMESIRREVEPYTADPTDPVPTLAQLDEGLVSVSGDDLAVVLTDPAVKEIRDRVFAYHEDPPKDMVSMYIALDELKTLTTDAVAGNREYEDSVLDEVSNSTHDAQRAIWGEIPAVDLVWTGIPSIIVFDITMDRLPLAEGRADGVSQVRDVLKYYEGLRGEGDADEYLALDALQQTLRETGLEGSSWGEDLAKGLGKRSDVIVRENSHGTTFPEEISLLSVDVWSRSLGGPIKLTEEYTDFRDSVREYERARLNDPAAEFYRISQLRNKVSKLYHAQKVQFLDSDKPAIQKYYNFLDRERTAAMDVVPEDLHFLWLGKLGQIQVEYIDVWMEKNPDYSVSLWHDEDAVLSYELSRQIKNRAYGIESDPSLSASANQKLISEKILALQTEADHYIRHAMANRATYDEAAADFMVARFNMDRAALEQIRLNNLKSYQDGIAYLEGRHGAGRIKLESVSDVWQANDNLREHYLQELALRGNLAAASDLARIRVLQAKGGIYVDADLLPKIDDSVFTGWQKKLSSLESRFVAARLSKLAGETPISQLTSKVRNRSIEASHRLFQNMVSQMVLETWGEASMPARNAKAHPTDGGTPGYSDYEKIILDAVKHDARFVSKLEEFKTHLRQLPREQLYASLDELRIAPGTIYAGITQREIIGNGFLATAGDNPYLQEWERIINQNYRLLEESGADVITSSDPAQLAGVLERMKVAHSRSAQTERDLEWMSSYRLDGLRESSIATASVSGPNALMQVYRNLDPQHFQFSPDEGHSPGVEQSSVDTDQYFSRYTEEDSKHSWMGAAEARPTGYYADSMRYDAQIIVRLGNSPEAVRASKFLYNKHASRSGIVTVDPNNPGVLRLVAGRIPPGGLTANSRITVVGHGTEEGDSYRIGGLDVEAVTSILSEGRVKTRAAELDLFPSEEGIQRLSIVSCNAPDDDGIPTGEMFGRELLENLYDLGRPVNDGISLRNGFVTVDAEGRKWVQVYHDENTIDDVLTNKGEGYKTIIRMGENGPELERVGIANGNVVKQLNFEYYSGYLNSGRQGLFDPIVASGSERVSSNRPDPRITLELSKHLAQGDVLVVADLQAVLAAMGDGEHRIAVMDDAPADLAGIQSILKMASLAETQEEWLSLVKNAYPEGGKALEAAINERGDALSFANMKRRINEDLFDFFAVDSSNPNAFGVIRADSQENFQAVYTSQGEMNLPTPEGGGLSESAHQLSLLVAEEDNFIHTPASEVTPFSAADALAPVLDADISLTDFGEEFAALDAHEQAAVVNELLDRVRTQGDWKAQSVAAYLDELGQYVSSAYDYGLLSTDNTRFVKNTLAVRRTTTTEGEVSLGSEWYLDAYARAQRSSEPVPVQVVKRDQDGTITVETLDDTYDSQVVEDTDVDSLKDLLDEVSQWRSDYEANRANLAPGNDGLVAQVQGLEAYLEHAVNTPPGEHETFYVTVTRHGGNLAAVTLARVEKQNGQEDFLELAYTVPAPEGQYADAFKVNNAPLGAERASMTAAVDYAQESLEMEGILISGVATPDLRDAAIAMNAVPSGEGEAQPLPLLDQPLTTQVEEGVTPATTPELLAELADAWAKGQTRWAALLERSLSTMARRRDLVELLQTEEGRASIEDGRLTLFAVKQARAFAEQAGDIHFSSAPAWDSTIQITPKLVDALLASVLVTGDDPLLATWGEEIEAMQEAGTLSDASERLLGFHTDGTGNFTGEQVLEFFKAAVAAGATEQAQMVWDRLYRESQAGNVDINDTVGTILDDIAAKPRHNGAEELVTHLNGDDNRFFKLLENLHEAPSQSRRVLDLLASAKVISVLNRVNPDHDTVSPVAVSEALTPGERVAAMWDAVVSVLTENEVTPENPEAFEQALDEAVDFYDQARTVLKQERSTVLTRGDSPENVAGWAAKLRASRQELLDYTSRNGIDVHDPGNTRLAKLVEGLTEATRFSDPRQVFYNRASNSLESISGTSRVWQVGGKKEWAVGDPVLGFKSTLVDAGGVPVYRYRRIGPGSDLLPDEFMVTPAGLPVLETDTVLRNIHGRGVEIPRAIFIQSDPKFNTDEFFALQNSLPDDTIFIPFNESTGVLDAIREKLVTLEAHGKISELPVISNVSDRGGILETTLETLALTVPPALLDRVYLPRISMSPAIAQEAEFALKRASGQAGIPDHDITLVGGNTAVATLPDQAGVWLQAEGRGYSYGEILENPDGILNADNGFVHHAVDVDAVGAGNSEHALHKLTEVSLIGVEDEYSVWLPRWANPSYETIDNDGVRGRVLATSNNPADGGYPTIQFTTDHIRLSEDPYLEVIFSPQTMADWRSGEVDQVRQALKEVFETLLSNGPQGEDDHILTSLDEIVERYNEAVSQRLGDRVAPWLVRTSKEFRGLQFQTFVEDGINVSSQLSVQTALDYIGSPDYIELVVGMVGTEKTPDIAAAKAFFREVLTSAHQAAARAVQAPQFEHLAVTGEFKAFLSLAFERVYLKVAHETAFGRDNKLDYGSLVRTSALGVMYEVLGDEYLTQIKAWMNDEGATGFNELVKRHFPSRALGEDAVAQAETQAENMASSLIEVADLRLNDLHYSLYTQLPGAKPGETGGYSAADLATIARAQELWHINPDSQLPLTLVDGKIHTVVELRNQSKTGEIDSTDWRTSDNPIVQMIRRAQGIAQPGLEVLAGITDAQFAALQETGLTEQLVALVEASENLEITDLALERQTLQFTAKLQETFDQAKAAGNQAVVDALEPLFNNHRWSRFFQDAGLSTAKVSQLLNTDSALRRSQTYDALVQELGDAAPDFAVTGRTPTAEEFAKVVKALARQHQGSTLSEHLAPLVAGVNEGLISVSHFADVVGELGRIANGTNMAAVKALTQHPELNLDVGDVFRHIGNNAGLQNRYKDAVGRLKGQGKKTVEHLTGAAPGDAPSGRDVPEALEPVLDAVREPKLEPVLKRPSSSPEEASVTSIVNAQDTALSASAGVVTQAKVRETLGRLQPMAAKFAMIRDIQRIDKAIAEKLNEEFTDHAGNVFRIGEKYILDEDSVDVGAEKVTFKLKLKPLGTATNENQYLDEVLSFELDAKQLGLETEALVARHEQEIAKLRHRLQAELAARGQEGEQAAKTKTEAFAKGVEDFSERAVTMANVALMGVGILQTARAIEDGNADWTTYLGGGSIAFFGGVHALQSGYKLASKIAKSLAPRAENLVKNSEKAMAETVAQATGTSVESAQVGTRAALSAGVAEAEVAETGARIAAGTAARLFSEVIPYVGIAVGLVFLGLDTAHAVKAFQDGNTIEGIGAVGDVVFDATGVVVDAVGAAFAPALPFTAVISVFLNVFRLLWDSSIVEVGDQLSQLPPDASTSDKYLAVTYGIALGIEDIVKEVTPWGGLEQTANLKKEHAKNVRYVSSLNDPQNYFGVSGTNDGHEEINFNQGYRASYGGEIHFVLGEYGEESSLTIGGVPQNQVSKHNGAIPQHDLIWSSVLDPSLNTIVLGLGETHNLTTHNEKAHVLWAIPTYQTGIITGDDADYLSLYAKYEGNSQDNVFWGPSLAQIDPTQDWDGDKTPNQDKDHELAANKQQILTAYHFEIHGGAGNDRIIMGQSNYKAYGGKGADTFMISTPDPIDNILVDYFRNNLDANYTDTTDDAWEKIKGRTREYGILLDRVIYHSPDDAVDTVFLDRKLSQIALIHGRSYGQGQYTGDHARPGTLTEVRRNTIAADRAEGSVESYLFSSTATDELSIYLLEEDYKGIDDLLYITPKGKWGQGDHNIADLEENKAYYVTDQRDLVINDFYKASNANKKIRFRTLDGFELEINRNSRNVSSDFEENQDQFAVQNAEVVAYYMPHSYSINPWEWRSEGSESQISFSNFFAAPYENLTTIIANDMDNVVVGNAQGNTIVGGAGDDTIDGGAGDDIIDGGQGIDHLTGGMGRDVYTFEFADFQIRSRNGDSVLPTGIRLAHGPDLGVANVAVDTIDNSASDGETDTLKLAIRLDELGTALYQNKLYIGFREDPLQPNQPDWDKTLAVVAVDHWDDSNSRDLQVVTSDGYTLELDETGQYFVTGFDAEGFWHQYNNGKYQPVQLWNPATGQWEDTEYGSGGFGRPGGLPGKVWARDPDTGDNLLLGEIDHDPLTGTIDVLPQWHNHLAYEDKYEGHVRMEYHGYIWIPSDGSFNFKVVSHGEFDVYLDGDTHPTLHADAPHRPDDIHYAETEDGTPIYTTAGYKYNPTHFSPNLDLKGGFHEIRIVFTNPPLGTLPQVQLQDEHGQLLELGELTVDDITKVRGYQYFVQDENRHYGVSFDAVAREHSGPILIGGVTPRVVDRFSDLERIGGTIYNDHLAGDDSANFIDGSSGVNRLTGRGGSDIYLTGDLASGLDTIDNSDSSDDPNLDTIIVDVDLNRMGLFRSGNDLVVSHLAEDQTRTDVVKVTRYFVSAAHQHLQIQTRDGYLLEPVQSEAFQPGSGDIALAMKLLGEQHSDAADGVTIDGTVWNHRDYIRLLGGSGNDTLLGNDQENILTGGAGDDTLSGGGGSDQLLGGEGSDTLAGGYGLDTIFIDNNGAMDTIDDPYNGPEKDLVIIDAQFKDITAARSGDNLVVSGENASVTLVNWFTDKKRRNYSFVTRERALFEVDKFGAVILKSVNYGSRDSIHLNLFEDNPLFGAPVIYGTDGDDQVYGNDEDNTFAPGKGDDLFVGGRGTDVLALSAGGGDNVFQALSADDTTDGSIDVVSFEFSHDHITSTTRVDDGLRIDTDQDVSVTLAAYFTDARARRVQIHTNDVVYKIRENGELAAYHYLANTGSNGYLNLTAPSDNLAESGAGSHGADFFIGNDLDNYFEGKGGADSYDGGQGQDIYLLQTGQITNETVRINNHATDGKNDNLILSRTNFDDITLERGEDHLSNTLFIRTPHGDIEVNSFFLGTEYQHLNLTTQDGVGAKIAIKQEHGHDVPYLVKATFDDAKGPSGVTRDLTLGGFRNVLAVQDSKGDDTYRGNALDNVFTSKFGNDTLAGGSGKDIYQITPSDNGRTITLMVEDSNDTIILNAPFVSMGNGRADGNDWLIPVGADTIRLKDWLTTDVTIKLQTQDGYGLNLDADGAMTLASRSFKDHEKLESSGWVGVTYRAWEDGANAAGGVSVQGTDYDDKLTGDGGDNTLSGGKGNDFFSGKDGSDTYLISAQGNTVIDNFSFDGASDTLTLPYAFTALDLERRGEDLWITHPEEADFSVQVEGYFISAAHRHLYLVDARKSVYLVESQADYRVSTERMEAEKLAIFAPSKAPGVLEIQNNSEIENGVPGSRRDGDDLIVGVLSYDVARVKGFYAQDAVFRPFFVIKDGRSWEVTPEGLVIEKPAHERAFVQSLLTFTAFPLVVQGVGEGLDIDLSDPANIGLSQITGTRDAANRIYHSGDISDNAYKIDGGDQNDAMDGGLGADQLSGKAGDDVLSAFDGEDRLDGGSGDDVLDGGAGDDVLTGGSGADVLRGGEGNDTVYYTGDIAGGTGVNVSLADGTGTGADAEGDTLEDVENVFGSAYDDTLTGDDRANILSGQAGDDTLSGDDGADTLIGGLGDNTLDGGEGQDIVDYSGSTSGVTVDLEAGTASHSGGTDTLSNIESVIGSDGDDVLTGNAFDNDFVGSLGRDVIDGGDGTDTVDYSQVDTDTGFHLDLAGNRFSASLSMGFPLGQGQEHIGDRNTPINGLVGFAAPTTAWVAVTGLGNLKLQVRVNDEYQAVGTDMGDGQFILTAEEFNRAFVQIPWNFHGGFDLTVTGGPNGAAALALATGDFQDVTLSNIENVTGSLGDDLIVGNDADNVISGGFGKDVIHGGAGDDTITGAALGASLDGGSGSDTLDYREVDQRLVVDLSQGFAAMNNEDSVFYGSQYGQGFDTSNRDTLANFETVLGGAYNDILLGNDQDNRLFGNDGDDILVAVGGSDIIDGGDGTDILSYKDYDQSVFLDLAYGQVVISDSERDSFTNVEGAQGGLGDDILTGRFGEDDVFLASRGNDTLEGLGGDGTDVVDYRVLAERDVDAEGLNLTSSVRTEAGEITVETENLDSNEYARIHLGDVVRVGTEYQISIGGVDSAYVVPESAESMAEIYAGLAQWLRLFTDLPAGVSVVLTEETGQSPYLSIQSDNLVLNGGFENHDEISATVGGYVDLPGWNSQGGWAVVQGADSDTPAPSGSSQIQLDDGNNLSVFQVIETQAGARYELNLAYSAGDFDIGHYSNSVEVWWNNQRIAILHGTDNSWDKYTYSLLATSESSRLEFRGVGAADGSGGLIDMVDLQLDLDRASNAAFIPEITVDSTIVAVGDSTRTVTWTDADGIEHSQTLSGIEQIEGSQAGDNLEGWEGSDILRGHGGDDFIFGHTGDDYLDGGAGDDLVMGEGGDDIIVGSLGLDTLYGGAGTDVLDYSELDVLGVNVYLNGGFATLRRSEDLEERQTIGGFEEVIGSAGDDRMEGDDQANLILGGAGNDQIAGQGGDDQIGGGEGHDRITGNDGDDIIAGNAGADVLYGEGGDDILLADFEDTTIDGGSGFDTLNLSSLGMGVTASLTSSTFQAMAAQVVPIQGFVGIEALTATDYQDLIQGLAGNDTLDAGGGDDWILATQGSDTIEGGDGFDVVDYGSYQRGITVNLAAGTVEKPLYVSAGHSLDTLSGIEGIAGTAFTDQLHGDDAGNLITGSTGDDVIDLGGGIDGVDYRNIDPSGSFQADLAAGTVSWTDGDGNTHTQSLSGVEHLVGSRGDDILAGSSGNDLLAGWTGDDTITGGAGNDHLSGGAGDDTLTGGAGDDHFYYGLGDGNDVIHAGAGSDNGLDTFHFGSGIGFDDLRISWSTDDYRIDVLDGEGDISGSLSLNGFGDQLVKLVTRDEEGQARTMDVNTLSIDLYQAKLGLLQTDLVVSVALTGFSTQGKDELTVAGLPEDATLNVGTLQDDGSWLVSASDADNGLTVTLPKYTIESRLDVTITGIQNQTTDPGAISQAMDYLGDAGDGQGVQLLTQAMARFNAESGSEDDIAGGTDPAQGNPLDLSATLNP